LKINTRPAFEITDRLALVLKINTTIKRDANYFTHIKRDANY
jgi:hypothetical protein